MLIKEDHRYSETHVHRKCEICGEQQGMVDVAVVEMEVPSVKFVSWVCAKCGHRNHTEVTATDPDWADPAQSLRDA